MSKNWTPTDFLDDETPGSKNPQKLSVSKPKNTEEVRKARESGFAFAGEEISDLPANTPIPDASFLMKEETKEKEALKETTWIFREETFAPETPEEEESMEADDEELKNTPNEEKKMSPAGNTFDWLKTFIFSLTCVIFVFTLLFRGVTVNGDSMLPTLENGEYLIISNRLYTPKTGDIVVVQAPEYKEGKEPLIKRVIATQGQEVKINFLTWQIWLDGVELKEDYILKDDYNAMLTEDMKVDDNGEVTFTVEKGCVFLMGDNRNDSLDSRSELVGQLDVNYIMGRVLLRVTPLSKMGKVD